MNGSSLLGAVAGVASGAVGKAMSARRALGPDYRSLKKARTEWYVDTWLAAAKAVDATGTRRVRNLVEVRRGAATAWFDHSSTDLDGPATLQAAGDKALMTQLMTEADLPVAHELSFGARSLGDARRFLAEHGPCVVKPARGTAAGAGITTNITDEAALRRAVARGSMSGTDLVIQEQVPGAVLRVLVLDGEIVDAVWQRPPNVVGDGRSTIDELIGEENSRRRSQGLERAQSLLDRDLDLRTTLGQQGIDLEHVPEFGQIVQVKTVVFQNTVHDLEVVTDRMHPDARSLAVRAAAAAGVRLAGVDLILPTADADPASGRTIVLEVNTTPGLFHHHDSDGNRVAATIVDRCLTTREVS